MFAKKGPDVGFLPGRVDVLDGVGERNEECCSPSKR